MDNIDKIKEKLKDNPELLLSLEQLIEAPRERNEIYIYCMQRETINGDIHYIPLMTILDNEKTIMACNDVKVLQEDYKQEVRAYEMYGFPLIIIEVPFHIYVKLSIDIEKRLNKKAKKLEDITKILKAEALLTNTFISNEHLPDFLINKIKREINYCKCLDEQLNIVECSEYKKISSNLISR